MVLDIIGGENAKALHGIQGVGGGEPTIALGGTGSVSSTEEKFILDLSPIIEEQPGSSLVEPAVTGAQRRGFKHPNNNDDANDSLLKGETERAEAQIILAEEQIKLTKLRQTKAKFQIRLLKAGLENAGLSFSNEEEP